MFTPSKRKTNSRRIALPGYRAGSADAPDLPRTTDDRVALAHARRKILVGAVILAKVERGKWPKERLREMLDQALTRADDRVLSGLLPLQEALGQTRPPSDPASQALRRSSRRAGFQSTASGGYPVGCLPSNRSCPATAAGGPEAGRRPDHDRDGAEDPAGAVPGRAWRVFCTGFVEIFA